MSVKLVFEDMEQQLVEYGVLPSHVETGSGISARVPDFPVCPLPPGFPDECPTFVDSLVDSLSNLLS